MKIYSSSEDYISNYPLIPYQFNLLQHSLIQIRENSAMGAGVAHGARSMIHIIQETIKENKNNSTETIIPFYNFYNHIMQLINQEHVMVINNAENNTRVSVRHPFINAIRKGDISADDCTLAKIFNN